MSKRDEINNYIPLGDEWEKEMMRWPKQGLADIFEIENKGTKKEMIKAVKNKLKEVSNE